jgi:hypothetical protein
MGKITNGYQNHQWYDHIDIVKDMELNIGCGIVTRKQITIKKWAKDK